MPKSLSPPPAQRQPDPRALRLQALCKNDTTVQGQWPLASMPRLAESFSGAADGHADWSLHTSTRQVAGGQAQLWARLQARAVAPLQCQRCLAPLQQPLEVDQLIRFVQGEEMAAQLDEESEEDVMHLPAQLNLYALLEDELILALPIVPRHEGTCPQPLQFEAMGMAGARAGAPGGRQAGGGEMETLEGEKKPHPFAVLAGLKTRKDP